MSSKALGQGMAYISVAGLAAGSDWLLFTLISWVLPTWDVLFAQAPARMLGGAVAFTMHRNWSFRDQQGRGLTTEARRFLGLYVFSFILSMATLYLLVDVFAINRFWGKAFADTLCFVVNFIVMKIYVFADARSLAHAAENLRLSKERADVETPPLQQR
jgi:putative flippase GtrA